VFANVSLIATAPGDVGLVSGVLAPEENNRRGIWRVNRATGETSLVTESISGFPAPGDIFYRLSQSTIDGAGRVYFTAARRVHNATSETPGVFTSPSGTTITPLILAGSPVAGGAVGETWVGGFELTQPDNAGRILMATRTTVGQRLMATTQGGALTTILRVGQTFPGTSTTVSGFENVQNSASGRFAFAANGGGSPASEGLWTGTSAADIQPVVLRGATAPGIASATFGAALFREIAPNGTIGFSAEYRIGSTTRVGAWVRAHDGQVSLVARPGMPVVGESGVGVQAASDVLDVNDSGSVVFRGFANLVEGLFVTTPAGIVRVASRDEAAPGGSTFNGQLDGAAINSAGTIVFEWLLSQDVFGNNSVFAYRPETGVVRVIGPGDVVVIAGAARTVTQASMIQPDSRGPSTPGPRGGLFDNNELFVRVRLDDNSTAILATFVPTPSAAATLASGMLLAMRRRRSARS
jgi:hypothetical protein